MVLRSVSELARYPSAACAIRNRPGLWGHFNGRHYIGDFNGDGRADLGFHDSNNLTFHVTTSTGTGFGGPGSRQWVNPNAFGNERDNFYPADYNGDGITDLRFARNDNSFWVRLSSGAGLNPPSEWLAPNNRAGTLLTGDFTGDGRADLAFFDAVNGTMRINVSTGSNLRGSGSGEWLARNDFGSQGARYHTADFNGDGITDLGYSETENSFHVTLSTGSGFGAAGSGRWIVPNAWEGRFYAGPRAR